MKTGKIVGLSLLTIVLLIGLSWGGTALGLLHMKVFEPKRQDIKREIFENTQSYVEGKRQEAIKMYREWNSAPADEKLGLEKMAGHTFANVEDDIFEEPLRTWVRNCKYGISNSPTRYNVPTEEDDGGDDDPKSPF